MDPQTLTRWMDALRKPYGWRCDLRDYAAYHENGCELDVFILQHHLHLQMKISTTQVIAQGLLAEFPQQDHQHVVDFALQGLQDSIFLGKLAFEQDLLEQRPSSDAFQHAMNAQCGPGAWSSLKSISTYLAHLHGRGYWRQDGSSQGAIFQNNALLSSTPKIVQALESLNLQHPGPDGRLQPIHMFHLVPASSHHDVLDAIEHLTALHPNLLAWLT